MDLAAGQNVAVASVFTVRLEQRMEEQADLVALLLDGRGQVRADADFVFYNAPHHPSGGVTLTDQGLSLNLRLLPAMIERVIVAADSNGAGGLVDLTVVVEGEERLTFSPSSLASLPTAVLVEVYRRSGGWRVRSVGQSWAAGLAALAREYGISVDAEPAQAASPEPDLAPVRSEVEQLTRRRDTLLQDVAELERRVSVNSWS